MRDHYRSIGEYSARIRPLYIDKNGMPCLRWYQTQRPSRSPKPHFLKTFAGFAETVYLYLVVYTQSYPHFLTNTSYLLPIPSTIRKHHRRYLRLIYMLPRGSMDLITFQLIKNSHLVTGRNPIFRFQEDYMK